MRFDPRFNPVAIVTLAATVAGLFGAYFMGQAAAQGNVRFIAIVFGVGAGMLVVFTMGNSIWLLIPLCWPLTGRLGGLPLPFSVRELAVIAAFGVFIAQIAMKRRSMHTSPSNAPELFLWLNAAFICTMFARNPVGVAFLGSDTVGGRPYLSVLVGLMAFIVLRFCFIPGNLAKVFPLLLLGPNFIVGFLGSITVFFPFLTPIIFPVYSGIDVTGYVAEEYFGQSGAPESLGSARISSFSFIGIALITGVVAYNNPLKAMSIGYPKLFFLMVLGTLFVGMAGFRNILFVAVLTVIIAAYLWNGGAGIIKTMLLGCFFLGAVIVTQSVVELPRSIQRSFSFFPGPWNPDIVKGANESTDWRFDMWKMALTTDRYIQNKLLGDGFGFSRTELEIMFNASIGGAGYVGADAAKEAFMVQGSFHSGPVSTIRFAGYIGLILLVVLMFLNAKYAWKLFNRAKGTQLQPLAIILVIYSLYSPVYFLFIFGEYRNDLPAAFFNLGMLKLLENSLAANTKEADAVAPKIAGPKPGDQKQFAMS